MILFFYLKFFGLEDAETLVDILVEDKTAFDTWEVHKFVDTFAVPKIYNGSLTVLVIYKFYL